MVLVQLQSRFPSTVPCTRKATHKLPAEYSQCREPRLRTEQFPYRTDHALKLSDSCTLVGSGGYCSAYGLRVKKLDSSRSSFQIFESFPATRTRVSSNCLNAPTYSTDRLVCGMHSAVASFTLCVDGCVSEWVLQPVDGIVGQTFRRRFLIGIAGKKRKRCINSEFPEQMFSWSAEVCLLD